MNNFANSIFDLFSRGKLGSENLRDQFHRNYVNGSDERIVVNLVDGVCQLLPLHNKIRARLAAQHDDERLSKYLELADEMVREHHDDDSETMLRFLDIAREYCGLDVFNTPSSPDTTSCHQCGATWKSLDDVTICEACGEILAFDDGIETVVPAKSSSKGHNKESFNNYLHWRYLGHPPASEMKEILETAKKIQHHLEDKPDAETGCQAMLNYLDAVGAKSQRKNIPLLCNIVWGTALPRLSPNQIALIRQYYESVDREYSRLKSQSDIGRTSALNSSYVLGKLLVMIGAEFDPGNLKPIETEITQTIHDNLWAEICRGLYWNTEK